MLYNLVNIASVTFFLEKVVLRMHIVRKIRSGNYVRPKYSSYLQMLYDADYSDIFCFYFTTLIGVLKSFNPETETFSLFCLLHPFTW